MSAAVSAGGEIVHVGRTGTALGSLANLLVDTGRYEEAEPLYRQALEIGRETLGEGHLDYAIRLNNLANLLTDTGRFEEAKPLIRQAPEIGRETLGQRHPEHATRLSNLATLLAATGRHEEAEPLIQQALKIGLENLACLIRRSTMRRSRSISSNSVRRTRYRTSAFVWCDGVDDSRKPAVPSAETAATVDDSEIPF